MFKQVVFKSLHGNFRKKVREPTLFPRALFVEKALGKVLSHTCFKRKKKARNTMNIWRRWQLRVPLAPSPIAVDFSPPPPPQLYEGLNMVNWQLTNGQNFNWQLTNRWKSNWQLINGGNFNRQMTFVPPHPDSCTPAALNITQVGMKSGWYGLSI